MKKNILLGVILAVILICGIILGAEFLVNEKEISVFLNGQQLTSDIEPMMFEEKVMVSVDMISKAIGCNSQWDPGSNNITFDNQLTHAAVKVGSYYIKVKDKRFDGGKIKTQAIPVAPIIELGSIRIPLEDVCEAFGAHVSWDEKEKRADVSMEILAEAFDEIQDFENGVAIVKKGNKSGLINEKGKLVIPAEYDKLEFKANFIVAEKDKNKGVIDKEGNIKVPIEHNYLYFFSFSEGTSMIKNMDEYGFIDEDGNLIIAMNYENGWPFCNGLAAVKLNGKWGYIDINENTIIPFQFDEAASFYRKEKAKVKLNGEEFYIDRNGKRID